MHSELRRLIHQRSKSKKIVFTNGCFDVLHLGHVRYLKAAKELGDLLVIGINSDNSVRSLKGPSRPINKLSARIEVLKELRCVDFVIPFEEETPLDLIQSIQPNILVKGGDYIKEDIIGNEFVISYGGKVIILDFHQGFSSSSIIAKLKS